MAQRPNDPSYDKDLHPPQFEVGERRMAYAADHRSEGSAAPPPQARIPAPTPSPEDFDNAHALSPNAVHSAGKPHLPARNRGITALAIVGGLLALLGIAALAFFMSPDYVSDDDIQQEEARMHVEQPTQPAP